MSNLEHMLSMRAVVFTAFPETVKSMRDFDPTLPYKTFPKCKPMPNSIPSDGSEFAALCKVSLAAAKAFLQASSGEQFSSSAGKICNECG